MPIGRNVSQKKKAYENSARLTMEYRRPQVWERTDRCHFPLPSKYQKRCAKSSTLLETSKWLHNPEPDCQDALPAFAWNCPSLIWSLPCSEAAAGSGTCARTPAQTPPVLPSPEPGPAPPAAAALHGNVLRAIIQGTPLQESPPVQLHKRMTRFRPPGQGHTSVNFSWELCAKWVQVFSKVQLENART